jgi:hypothetical protein
MKDVVEGNIVWVDLDLEIHVFIGRVCNVQAWMRAGAEGHFLRVVLELNVHVFIGSFCDV